MNKSHEIIVVTYIGDIAALYLQALSLIKFWKGDKNYTIVIEDNREETQLQIKEYILPLFQGWDTKILIAPKIDKGSGWHRQQYLKLWAASNSDKNYSIILDSKNLIIRSYDLEHHFIEGKLKAQLYTTEYMNEDDTKRNKTACEYFEKDFYKVTKCFSITPFIWNNQLVRDMISFLNAKGIDYLNWDIYNTTYESALYWIYAQDKINYINFSGPIQLGQYGGPAKEFTEPLEKFKNMIKESKNNPVCCIFTFHRFHTFPSNSKLLIEYLLGLEIVNDNSINNYYKILNFNRKYIEDKVLDYLRVEWDNL